MNEIHTQWDLDFISLALKLGLCLIIEVGANLTFPLRDLKNGVSWPSSSIQNEKRQQMTYNRSNNNGSVSMIKWIKVLSFIVFVFSILIILAVMAVDQLYFNRYADNKIYQRKINLERYSGQWYQILETKTELPLIMEYIFTFIEGVDKSCSNTVVNYTLQNKDIF